MSLKSFVNNKDMWDAFLEEIEDAIKVTQRGMEQAEELTTLYRLQGSIMTLRKLKQLRDKVNGIK